MEQKEPTFEDIRDVVQKCLGYGQLNKQDITETTDIYELGADSFDAFQISVVLEQKYDVSFYNADEIRTIQDIIKFIQNEHGKKLPEQIQPEKQSTTQRQPEKPVNDQKPEPEKPQQQNVIAPEQPQQQKVIEPEQHQQQNVVESEQPQQKIEETLSIFDRFKRNLKKKLENIRDTFHR